MTVWNGTKFIISTNSKSTEGAQVMNSQTEQFLLKANNLSDIQNRNIARQNLGISVSITEPTAPHLNDLWVDLNN